MPDRIGSIIIENVQPSIDGGRHPVKRIVGEDVKVSADLFKEGHDVLVAVVRWRQVTPAPAATEWEELPMRPVGNDRFEGSFPVHVNGRYAFAVESWPDLFATWVSELQRKVDAGRDVTSELLEGAVLLEGAAERAVHSARDAQRMRDAAALFRSGPSPEVIRAALEPSLSAAASRHPDRSIGVRSDRELEIFADRRRAEVGAWYEFFPRSTRNDGKTHGTFKDAEKFLEDVQGMGFDVVYLPPIHPIGRTARKGRNNSLVAEPGDVGSPWAIGAAEGGHKAVHPELGTLEDFQNFVQAAKRRGIEVALDIAFQVSPDHPYVKEHPEWFSWRPDGTLKTAENPPKRYEDISNFDWLGPARDTLWDELRSVFVFWIERGVRIFRVDNPHTKPIPFWEWAIRQIQDVYPDVVFLSEAFTRPKVMRRLAKIGFSQSYTYFTWRNFKKELQEYLEELTQSEDAEYMRGNLWPNTPDILPEVLQEGGRPAFKIRIALAATLSSVYGVYSGYELLENKPVKPGKEEYLDSEKYQLVARDWNREGNIRPFMTALNRIRRENPALLEYKNLRFYRADNDRVIFYGKHSRDGTNTVLIAVSMDPFAEQASVLHVPLHELGVGPEVPFEVHELLSNRRALWQGHTTTVRLTPEEPAAIWQVLPLRKTEKSFDYYY